MDTSRRRRARARQHVHGGAHPWRTRPVVAGLATLLATGAACSGGDPEPTAAPEVSPSAATPSDSSPSAAGGRWPDLPGSGLPADVADRLEAEMTSWVDRGMLPGVTAAVAGPQGVWVGAAGVDGAGIPLTPDAGMSLLQITWSFTAAEVMLLAEQGKVDLDAPAATYVPVRQVANGVTVRQLLEHRAGIPDPGAADLEESWSSRPDAHWTTARYLRPVGRATDPPGEELYFDTTNYELLGLVVEKVSGERLGAAYRQDLWAPLGLTRLALQDEQRLPPPLAAPGRDPALPDGIADDRYLPFRTLVSAVRASVGAAGDAESVARWGYALHGGHLLEPESVAQMTDFADDDWGLGMFDCATRILESPSIDCIGNEAELMGYSVVLVVVPSAQTSVAVLSPSTNKAYGFVKWLMSAGDLLGNASS